MTLDAFLSIQSGRVKAASAAIQQREARRQPAETTKAVPQVLAGWPVHIKINRVRMGYLQAPGVIRNA